MSRFASEVSRNNGTNKRDGTRVRDTENRDIVPSRFPSRSSPDVVPFCDAAEAIAKVALMSVKATAWEKAFIRGVLAYAEKHDGATAKQLQTLADVASNVAARSGLTCPLCQAQHTLSQCKRWRQS